MSPVASLLSQTGASFQPNFSFVNSFDQLKAQKLLVFSSFYARHLVRLHALSKPGNISCYRARAADDQILLQRQHIAHAAYPGAAEIQCSDGSNSTLTLMALKIAEDRCS